MFVLYSQKLPSCILLFQGHNRTLKYHKSHTNEIKLLSLHHYGTNLDYARRFFRILFLVHIKRVWVSTKMRRSEIGEDHLIYKPMHEREHHRELSQ